MIELLGIAPLTALAYWLRGRGVRFAKTLNGFVWALPLLFLAEPWWALAWFAGVGVAAKLTMQLGHGDYFDLARTDYEDRESTQFLLDWIEEEYWNDAAGMMLTGVIGIAPVAIGLAFVVHPLFALVALAGVLKWPAYELAWRLKPTDPIWLGELFFGASAGLSLCVACLAA